MRAAAENLTPVTLELGGKSPAIIGPGRTIALRETRRAHRRRQDLNAGQTCIAPDYVLVPAGQEQAFIAARRRSVPPATRTSCARRRLFDDRHRAPLPPPARVGRGGARAGREVVELSAAAEPTRRRGASRRWRCATSATGMQVMQEEIFGPLLPVVPYRDLDEAIAYVNARPNGRWRCTTSTSDRGAHRPRAGETVSGGVTINDTILHIAQDELPFGGVGPSGMGCYHGFEGFETFSEEEGGVFQSRVNGIGLFKPPYGALFERMVKVPAAMMLTRRQFIKDRSRRQPR
jgi:coniferyl-aldehyde dehydrogenase